MTGAVFRARRVGACPSGGAGLAAGRFDWGGWMRAGIGGLGLRPAEFWALTPAELRLMLGMEPAAPPLTRARLAALAARFPDRVAGQKERADDQA